MTETIRAPQPHPADPAAVQRPVSQPAPPRVTRPVHGAQTQGRPALVTRTTR